jgi:hypothetical protein
MTLARFHLRDDGAADSVCSPPPSGVGWGVGVVRFLQKWRDPRFTASPPSPTLPRLRGRGQTEFAARVSPAATEEARLS